MIFLDSCQPDYVVVLKSMKKTIKTNLLKRMNIQASIREMINIKKDLL